MLLSCLSCSLEHSILFQKEKERKNTICKKIPRFTVNTLCSTPLPMSKSSGLILDIIVVGNWLKNWLKKLLARRSKEKNSSIDSLDVAHNPRKTIIITGTIVTASQWVMSRKPDKRYLYVHVYNFVLLRLSVFCDKQVHGRVKMIRLGYWLHWVSLTVWRITQW